MNKLFLSVGFLLSALLIGCGGGGGSDPANGSDSSSVNSPTGNPALRSIQRVATGFTYPGIPNTNGYVVVKGSSIYVSDNTKVWSLSFSGQVNQTLVVNDPRGMAVMGGALNYAANPLSANANIYVFPDNTNPQVNSHAYNFGSLAAFNASLYAVDYTLTGQVLKFDNNGQGNAIGNLSGPSYITSDANYVYVTKENGGVAYIDQSGNTNTFTWAGITNPKGIVIVGGYAYVVSQASTDGNDAVILRVKLSDGTVDTYVDGQNLGTWDSGLSKGFCGPTGIAANTQDGYLYVINGYCQGANAVINNRSTLLRIKI